MVAFIRPGLSMVELAHVPVRHATSVGRIDVLDGRMILTIYEKQPGGNDGDEEAVVVDRISFSMCTVPDEILFVLSVLAKIGARHLLDRVGLAELAPIETNVH